MALAVDLVTNTTAVGRINLNLTEGKGEAGFTPLVSVPMAYLCPSQTGTPLDVDQIGRIAYTSLFHSFYTTHRAPHLVAFNLSTGGGVLFTVDLLGLNAFAGVMFDRNTNSVILAGETTRNSTISAAKYDVAHGTLRPYDLRGAASAGCRLFSVSSADPISRRMFFSMTCTAVPAALGTLNIDTGILHISALVQQPGLKVMLASFQFTNGVLHGMGTQQVRGYPSVLFEVDVTSSTLSLEKQFNLAGASGPCMFQSVSAVDTEQRKYLQAVLLSGQVALVGVDLLRNTTTLPSYNTFLWKSPFSLYSLS
jgi:hypothetical protein